jgi:hypothetical protein
MNEMIFEGKKISLIYTTEEDFQDLCDKSGIEIKSKEKLEYPFINTDFSTSHLYLYTYISKKTGKECYAYENSFGGGDTWGCIIYNCSEKIEDVEGMISEYDRISSQQYVMNNFVYTFSEAAELWGLGESTLRKARFDGRFLEGEIRQSGSTWLVTRQAMERLYGESKKPQK